jgi:hypothetical protein
MGKSFNKFLMSACYDCEMKKRIKALKFHIEQGDYFGTLATILDLLRQGIVDKQAEKEVLKNLTNDLLYLQKHCRILQSHFE